MPIRPWRPVRQRPSIRPQRRRSSAPHSVDPAARMRAAASWPLDECLVSEGWSSGRRVTVVWVRRHPDQPRYAIATVRADLSGGGIEAAEGRVDLGRAATWTAIEEAHGDGRLTRCDPALAVKLLYAAVDRAPAHSADPNWLWVSELLGSTDPDRSAVPLPPCGSALEPPLPEARSLAEHLRRASFAMFSPVAFADA